MIDAFPINYPEMVVEKSTGTTPTEKKLAELGYNTFLRLWSYPNPYKMQSESQELCDLLVVFEDNIIIFSVKECIYGTHSDKQVNWCRWYKRAIKKSADQLLGAKNWIKRYPDRIALDAKREHPFPLDITITENTKFYLVSVAHGASDQCKMHYSGGDGGLMLDNQIIGDMHIDANCMPFWIGLIEADPQCFVHIFDHIAYETVLRELDTIQDFIDYLDDRKALLLSKHIRATSEVEMLAHHISGLIKGNSQALQNLAQQKNGSIWFLEGLWSELICSPEYIEWKKSLEKSYFLDALLQKTFFFIEHGLSEHISSPTLQDQSVLFHKLAKMDRRNRLAMADAILSFFAKVPKEFRGTRIICNLDEPDVCYVLFLLPRTSGISDTQYRKVRREMLSDYCIIAKAERPEVKHIVGIAHEPADSENSSEDFVYLNASEWTDANQKYALQLMDEYRSHGCLSRREYNSKNYFD